MMFAKSTWLSAVTLIMTAGFVGLGACSSTTTGSSSQVDSGAPGTGTGSGTGTGTGTGSGTGTGTGTGTGSGSGSGGTPDGGTTCPTKPTLYPDTAVHEYCLHDANSATLYCTTPSQICCLGGSDTSICAVAGTTCPAPLVTLNCTDSVECGAGQICCASGPAPALDMGCGFFEETGMTSSTCVSGTTCPGGLFQLCGSTADCATCTPFHHSSGDQLGFCN